MFIAMKKLLLTTSLCLVFFVFFGFSVYAESEDNVTEVAVKREVLNYFNYDDQSLVDLVEVSETSIFIGPTYSVYELENIRKEQLKDLGPLQLSSGFVRERLTTFSKTKALSGLGKENAVVGIHVFHIQTISNNIDGTSKQVIVSTQDRLVKLGKSGLYSETICFNHVGVNYVLIAVIDPETKAITKKLFKVTLKELETRNKLENITVNFFEEVTESPKLEEFVPEISNFGF